MTVAVVVDSAASLPSAVAAELGITVVPMALVVDGHPMTDREISVEALAAHLDGGSVSTSGPNAGDFVRAIEQARAGADEVLVLTLSAEMSSTFAAAEVAATLVEGGTRVVDTRTAAGGEGLVVVAAARRAAAGASLDEVEAEARRVMDRVHLVATVPDLEHLRRSGRVPGIAAAAAHSLHVHPLFEFREGAARALKPAIGGAAALHRIVQRCLADRPRDTPAVLHVAALEAIAADDARTLLDAVLAEVPDADAFVGSFGPVMLVHVGPGLVGLAWWWEPTGPAGDAAAEPGPG